MTTLGLIVVKGPGGGCSWEKAWWFVLCVEKRLGWYCYSRSLGYGTSGTGGIREIISGCRKAGQGNKIIITIR